MKILITFILWGFLTPCLFGQEYITDWIQQQLDAGHQVQLGNDDYYITKTIRLPHGYGHRIIGVGMARDHIKRSENRFPMVATRLYAAMPPGDPMFSITGTFQGISNLTISGRSAWNKPGQSHIGVMIARQGTKGLGTGKCRFDNLIIQSFDRGFQCGTFATEHNADTSQWNNVYFFYCITGVKFASNQAIDHVLRDCFFQGVYYPIELAAGGHIELERPTVVLPPKKNRENQPMALIYFTDEYPRQYRLGRNNSHITVKGLKVDSRCKDYFRIADMDPEGFVNGAIMRVSDSQVSFREYQQPFLRAGGTITFKFDNCQFFGLKSETADLWQGPRGFPLIEIDGEPWAIFSDE